MRRPYISSTYRKVINIIRLSSLLRWVSKNKRYMLVCTMSVLKIGRSMVHIQAPTSVFGGTLSLKHSLRRPKKATKAFRRQLSSTISWKKHQTLQRTYRENEALFYSFKRQLTWHYNFKRGSNFSSFLCDYLNYTYSTFSFFYLCVRHEIIKSALAAVRKFDSKLGATYKKCWSFWAFLEV